MKADALCRSCKQPIRWVRVLPGMKRTPMDPEPADNGNLWVDHWEGGTPVMAVAANHDAVPRYEPHSFKTHFATCPEAKEWRQGK